MDPPRPPEGGTEFRRQGGGSVTASAVWAGRLVDGDAALRAADREWLGSAASTPRGRLLGPSVNRVRGRSRHAPFTSTSVAAAAVNSTASPPRMYAVSVWRSRPSA